MDVAQKRATCINVLVHIIQSFSPNLLFLYRNRRSNVERLADRTAHKSDIPKSVTKLFASTLN